MDATITFLEDLAIVCGVSGIVALVFHYSRLCLLLGYVIDGFLIGPHSLYCIHEAELINQRSELDVVFLMSYVGLEFDFMKLKRIFAPSAF
jgi:CPA2 family monovalent cation:H+ antiporter-2